jgi:hypothetical protein
MHKLFLTIIILFFMNKFLLLLFMNKLIHN